MDVLRRIFQNFTMFGDRRNTQFMTDFKFYKIISLAKIAVLPPLYVCVCMHERERARGLAGRDINGQGD